MSHPWYVDYPTLSTWVEAMATGLGIIVVSGIGIVTQVGVIAVGVRLGLAWQRRHEAKLQR